MNRKPQVPVVIFCEKCGHSYYHTLLATGHEDCGRTVVAISLAQWAEIAKDGTLALTEAGRRALQQEGPKSHLNTKEP